MDVQLVQAKSVQTLVIYVRVENLEAARKAVTEVQDVLAKYGFVKGEVTERKAKTVQ